MRNGAPRRTTTMGTTGTGDHLGLLREAIARNAAMILSLPGAGGLRHHKSRFLADAGDGFWVASVADAPGVIEGLIASQQPAGVSFRSGETKVIFASPIQHAMEDFHPAGGADVGDPGPGPALLLRFPDDVRAVQRRKSFRVPIAAASSDLRVRLWTMPEHARLRDRPLATREIESEPRDISVGGIGLRVRPAAENLPALAAGERLRVQLTLGATVALLEGRLRYAPRPMSDGTLRVGVQFRTLGDSRDDRQAASQLNRIVNQLQRDLIRRKKLGL